MVLLALSLQDQVEKYGSYVGIAAFFGLAVLSLLYFSQARELKRLRDWAGRAPERARELEQRVVAEAAGAARRAPAIPGAPQDAGAIAPPRRLAEMPVPPPAAQTAAGAQATELADAVEQEESAEPATNGNVPSAPPPPGAEVADAVNGGAPPAEQRDGKEAAEADGDEQEGAPAPEGEAADEQQDAEPADATAAEAGAAQAGDAASTVAEPGEASAAAPGADTADPEPAPGEVPAAVPRATPAQRVGVTPRPAPMPLRQSRSSASPAGQAGARRPGAPAPRRPRAAPREGRSAGTLALFVGLAVLILGGGAFAVSQVGGDDSPSAPNRSTPPPTRTGAGVDGSRKTAAETNVAVLNGTTFTGLAGQLADRVSQEGGYQRGATETNTRDQTIQTSTVYYADGFRGQARKVGELLSISAIEPLDEETQALTPDADVVVLAGADQAP